MTTKSPLLPASAAVCLPSRPSSTAGEDQARGECRRCSYLLLSGLLMERRHEEEEGGDDEEEGKAEEASDQATSQKEHRRQQRRRHSPPFSMSTSPFLRLLPSFFAASGSGQHSRGESSLELEALTAVHQFAIAVQSIAVSEMLPRTPDLIFVNLTTLDGQPYCLELTAKGWRVTSLRTDCMQGDLKFEQSGPGNISALLGRLMLMGILKLDIEMRNIEESDIGEQPQIDIPSAPKFDNDGIFYWFQALDSRGFVFLDHFLDPDPDESAAFFKIVLKRTKKCLPRALKALEMLADKLTERIEVRHEHGLVRMFEEIEGELDRSRFEREESLKAGYERYFSKASLDEVDQFRKRFALFEDLLTLPKMISRLGQCFTQGKDIKRLDLKHRMDGFDIIGGANSSGKLYTFSDGCGSISVRITKGIAAEFGFDKRNMPSCYQFRYAGYKGVVSVNPEIDRMIIESDKNKEKSLDMDKEDLHLDFYFRPSQKKFDISEEEERKCCLEIVKHSAPSSVYMNRPFINVLDQTPHPLQLDVPMSDVFRSRLVDRNCAECMLLSARDLHEETIGRFWSSKCGTTATAGRLRCTRRSIAGASGREGCPDHQRATTQCGATGASGREGCPDHQRATTQCGTTSENKSPDAAPPFQLQRQLKQCNRCECNIATLYYEVCGHAYCYGCYTQWFSLKCCVCQVPLEDVCIVEMGKHWHVDCFRCALCNEPLMDWANDVYYEVPDTYCYGCYTQRFSPKCCVCQVPLEDVCIVEMGKHWHVDCFRCAHCDEPLMDWANDVYYEVRGRPYHYDCHFIRAVKR